MIKNSKKEFFEKKHDVEEELLKNRKENIRKILTNNDNSGGATNIKFTL